MRIYLDACCYNRPFDDPHFSRVHLEAEAIIAILNHVRERRWELIGSDAVSMELNATRSDERRAAVLGLLAAANKITPIGQTEYDRSRELMNLGFKQLDSLHIACAETAGCDVILTTDDRLLHKAGSNSAKLKLEIRNPLDWLLEQKT